MFDRDGFIADCRSALSEDTGYRAVREVIARAVSEPAAVIEGLGPPTRSGIQTLYQSEDLTILNIVWGAKMTMIPHNHTMWALIGIYTGREDNILWRRVAGESGGKIEAAGAKALVEREVFPLGRDAIHSVTNPIPRLTGAIHVYGGNFFEAERSEWDPETLLEHPYDIGKILRLYEEANVG
uniref:Predicted metal-dependent enzyme of the double-stranded beta helix superfamily n=1 Tax=Candidatus Kentrum eta TaxID=2126337 RepID=A0A450UY75_9GAMM|nr:MAG: Predicted metal-dependent enzyme of the double-stranded beta helix superfamily [Candidatus Kentron sp. H]VFJ91144.1 MAG: Predicted metal-dependent enzyme of the double-stranded beta helix superfamily [Candidatus Kentron sp. H]VFJ97463.1 MAG: Predicted metal-dependent enzyme of the double-stranded beta helix superfamily [Candidatus Kentron sp. H]